MYYVTRLGFIYLVVLFFVLLSCFSPNDAATTPQNGVTDSPSTHGVTDSPSHSPCTLSREGPRASSGLAPTTIYSVHVAPPPRRGRPVSRRVPRRSTSTRSVGKHILEVRARSSRARDKTSFYETGGSHLRQQESWRHGPHTAG